MGLLNKLIFDGVDSSDYGVYISGEGTYNAPARRGEKVSIPGRNGDLIIDEGAYENIPVTYPAFIGTKHKEEFDAKIEALRAELVSRGITYKRLTDTYHPDEFRLGVYREGLEVEPTMHNRAGKFDIVFDCKPQRFLLSGEEPQTIGEWGETETETGEIVSFEAESNTSIKSLVASIEPIQDLNGQEYPYPAGGGKNKWNTQAYIGLGYNTAVGTIVSLTESTCTVNGNTISYDVSAWGSRSFKTNPLASGTHHLHFDATAITNPRISMYRINSNNEIVSVSNSTSSSVHNANFACDDGDYIAVFIGSNTAQTITFTDYQVESGSSYTSWSPYSNICPISGWDEVKVEQSGINILDVSKLTEDAGNYILNDNGVQSADSQSSYYLAKISVKPNTDYYFNGGAGVNGMQRLYYFDIDDNFISRTGAIGSARAITTPSNCAYIRIQFRRDSLNKDTWGINYPSADTEYHAYNGQSHTITLPSTVYGGEINVVSGEGKDGRDIIDLSTLAWNMADSVHFRSRQTSYQSSSDWDGDWQKTISNCLKSEYPDTPFASRSGNSFANIKQNYYNFDVKTATEFASVSEFVAFLSNVDGNGTHAMVLIEKATPIDFTTTPEQIETLLGTNTIWADSGEVTVEFGADPNILVNPTPFDALPLIEAEGYGTIIIDGQSISIVSQPIGDVTAWIGNIVSSDYPIEIPVDTSQFSTGDTIRLSAVFTFMASGSFTSRTQASATSDNADIIVNNASFVFGNNTVQFDVLTANEIEFTVGTSKTVEASLTINTTNPTNIFGAYLGIVYDPANRVIYFSANFHGEHPRLAIDGSVEGYSTKIMDTNTFIDCEIGEAYYIEDGEVISANNSVTIPAILPKLKTGNNDITYDNTITELKIIPRWWKI